MCRVQDLLTPLALLRVAIAALTLSLSFMSACFSTRTAGQDAITAMRTPGRDQALVVDGARFSPVERIRVGDGAGRFGPRLYGSQLYVGAQGLYARTSSTRRLVVGARVTGLSPQQEQALRAQAPYPEALSGDAKNGFALQVGGNALSRWLGRFRDTDEGRLCAEQDACGVWVLVLDLHGRTGRRSEPEKPDISADELPLDTLDDILDDELDGELPGGVPAEGEPAESSVAGDDDPAAAVPEGALYEGAVARDTVDSEPMTSVAALRAVRTGVPNWIGWSWDQLHEAEIKALSGPKTMGAVFGVPLAIAGMFAGGLHILNEVLKRSDDHMPSMPLPPSLLGEPDEEIRPLFSSRLRRRSGLLYLLNVQSDVQAGFSGVGAHYTLGVTAGVRLREVLDFEVGFRAAGHRGYVRQYAALPAPGDATPDAPANWPRTDLSAYAVVFRFGFHFPLDAYHRFAIPVGIEVGAGPGSRYFQTNFGLRLSLSERAFVGIYPFNPTRVNFGQDADPGDKTYWSFQSGIELGVNL